MSEWMKCVKRPVVVQYRHVRPGEECIHTLEGIMDCNSNYHYIIKGVKGEEYPIAKDIFRETYDLIPDENTMSRAVHATIGNETI